jgi:hypothetical protein
MSMVASSVLLLGAPVARHIKVAGAADVNPGSGLRARRSSPTAVSAGPQPLLEPGDRVIVTTVGRSTDVSPGAGAGSARRDRQLEPVDARCTQQPKTGGQRLVNVRFDARLSLLA